MQLKSPVTITNVTGANVNMRTKHSEPKYFF
jgi:hypothetical protein